MPKVVLSLPRLGVTPRGWEQSKEVYVLSFAADLAATTENRKQPDVIAAYNETLPNVAPDLMEAALLRYIVVTVSNVFPRIRPDQAVSLSGSGILLYPHLDPAGLLACHFMVVESDEGKRRLGKVLEEILADDTISGAVQALLSAGVTQPLLATLLAAVVHRVPRILRRNRDDVLFAHSHSGFDFDDYGRRPGENPSDFLLGNDRAFCTLRVLTTD